MSCPTESLEEVANNPSDAPAAKQAIIQKELPDTLRELVILFARQFIYSLAMPESKLQIRSQFRTIGQKHWFVMIGLIQETEVKVPEHELRIIPDYLVPDWNEPTIGQGEIEYTPANKTRKSRYSFAYRDLTTGYEYRINQI